MNDEGFKAHHSYWSRRCLSVTLGSRTQWRHKRFGSLSGAAVFFLSYDAPNWKKLQNRCGDGRRDAALGGAFRLGSLCEVFQCPAIFLRVIKKMDVRLTKFVTLHRRTRD
jgi:hypothetical protein